MIKQFLSKWLLGDIVEKYSTNAPFERVIEVLSENVNKKHFSVVTVHDMKETYTKNHLHIADDFEYRIVQICNAPKSHNALTNMSFDMGVMMPKSLIVARENGKTSIRFMKMKPWMVSMMLPKLDIAPMSKMVSEIMSQIVSDTIREVEKPL